LQTLTLKLIRGMNPAKQNNYQNNKNSNANQQKEGSFRLFRNTQQTNPKDATGSNQKISEKEYYDQLKIQIESQSDNLDDLISNAMRTLIQQNFSAYQFFKILATSKAKSKLKFASPEKEHNFYTNFWHIMDLQKASIKTEGLKLLGFLSSDHLQNISLDIQLTCIKHLNQLSNLKNQARNTNIIRLAYNCIGNIISNSNHKILDTNQEIFYNIYELIKDINTPQKLEDENNVKTLAAALRVLSLLYIDLKTMPPNVGDFLISQLIRYIYLGTSFFALPSSASFGQGDTSSDSAFGTSSSEISDTDESVQRKKEDETCAKIRNYSAVCLANIFRHNNKIISQYFSTLLPCKVLRKDVSKFIETFEKPLVLWNLDLPEKRNKRVTHIFDFRNDFNEPTLLNLLLFEANSKVKLSVCKTLAAILDGYQGDKLLLTIDGAKLEKTKIDPYKSISHQIYQNFKNLSFAVCIAIMLETDETVLNHLIRLASTILSHPSYDKVGRLTIHTFINKILSKLLLQYNHHTIYLSCIACFSALASGNARHKEYDKLAFKPEFNIVEILMQNILEYLSSMPTSNEIKTPKNDRVPDSTLLLESLIALSKFPKYYVEQILQNVELLINILQKVQELEKKYTNISFKIIEEIMKYMNEYKEENDNQEMEIETIKKEKMATGIVSTIQMSSFHKFVASFLNTAFSSSKSSDYTEHVLDILYYLNEQDWEDYYSEIKEKFIDSLLELNYASFNLSFLKLLGKTCIFTSFMNIDRFPKLVSKVILNNVNEKNNNTIIKNSWVLANLCTNCHNFDLFSLEENQQLLLTCLSYCNSTKEKIVSNGFRALGYFISNHTDESLCKTLALSNTNADKIKTSLREVYKKPFTKCSVKVCWNVCVSLSNILRSFKPNFTKTFFTEDIFFNIAEILTAKNNFKTQIHCIEMFTLAYQKFPENPCFPSFMKTLIQLYFASEESDFDVSELRYLPHLRKDISKLLLNLLKNIDFEKTSNFVAEILSSVPHKLFKVIYDSLENLYKDHKDKLIEEKFKDEETTSSPTIKPQDDLLNFDEVMVKGTTDLKTIIIPKAKLSQQDLQFFKETLQTVIFVSRKLINFIDSSEELAVPFSAYNSLKQLSDIDLDAQDNLITIRLDQI